MISNFFLIARSYHQRHLECLILLRTSADLSCGNRAGNGRAKPATNMVSSNQEKRPSKCSSQNTICGKPAQQVSSSHVLVSVDFAVGHSRSPPLGLSVDYSRPATQNAPQSSQRQPCTPAACASVKRFTPSLSNWRKRRLRKVALQPCAPC